MLLLIINGPYSKELLATYYTTKTYHYSTNLFSFFDLKGGFASAISDEDREISK